VVDPRVDQPQMKKSLSFLQEASLPTIPWGTVGDPLEEEIDPSTTYSWTITSLDHQEDPSSLPGDPRVDHHRRLDAANQVWQGPHWTVRTQNLIPVSRFVAAVRCSR
jgi:hypothetical protein